MKSQLTMLTETGSTNDDALTIGRVGAPHGTAIAARLQTAGRGRRGHIWESPRGNLYLSVVLRPEVAPARLPGLAAACGLGAAEALEQLEFADQIRLKWPNDVLVCGRKLAGILVEAARGESGAAFAVCGIGVNVEHAPRGLEATCLADHAAGPLPELETLAELLRASIADQVSAWTAMGAEHPLDGILEDYLALLAWRGEKVRVISPEGTELAAGTLDGVDIWGRAIVDGRAWTSEQASLRPA